ncbi:MAG: SRPBCC domain-containing protein [Candidatus Sericytochromatia bacterium]|nr:SRPBCC domain-containing protein [Candidatus Sericytochromatia bacterium]
MNDDLPETALRLTRRFAASRERVFRAWTQSQTLVRWFCCPGDGYVGLGVEVDFEVDGQFRASMRNPNDEILVQFGTYCDIIEGERIVFTYAWEGVEFAEMMGETMVSVVFQSLGEATEVTLTHVGFPDDSLRDEHAWGWDGCFDALERLLATKLGVA